MLRFCTYANYQCLCDTDSVNLNLQVGQKVYCCHDNAAGHAPCYCEIESAVHQRVQLWEHVVDLQVRQSHRCLQAVLVDLFKNNFFFNHFGMCKCLTLRCVIVVSVVDIDVLLLQCLT